MARDVPSRNAFTLLKDTFIFDPASYPLLEAGRAGEELLSPARRQSCAAVVALMLAVLLLLALLALPDWMDWGTGGPPPVLPMAAALGWLIPTVLAVGMWRRLTRPSRFAFGEITQCRMWRDGETPDRLCFHIEYDFITPDGRQVIGGEADLSRGEEAPVPAAGMPVVILYDGPRRYRLL